MHSNEKVEENNPVYKILPLDQVDYTHIELNVSPSSNGHAERILAPAAVVIASPGIACNVILSVHLGWQNLE